MVGLLSQMAKGVVATLRRFAGAGSGPGGVCRCGWPLFEVADESRGWCRRCGFPPEKPEPGWLKWCPGCGFPLNPPAGDMLYCAHCRYTTAWPPRHQTGRPRRKFNLGV
jgi:hypothetical protein